MKTIRLSFAALLLAVSLTSFIGCVSVHRDEPATMTRTTQTTTVPSGTTVERSTTVY